MKGHGRFHAARARRILPPLVAAAVLGCAAEDPPCAALTFLCAAPGMLELRVLGEHDSRPGGPAALGARGDILLSNGAAVAVIAGLGNQNYLSPRGGDLIDLAIPGADNDGMNQALPLVGILPRDLPSYTSLTLIDERPQLVAVELAGTLFGQPDAPIRTRYEMRPCDPGVRARTEVRNRTPDPQLWALSDGHLWAVRVALPFTPAPGGGFDHPPFTEEEPNEAYRPASFMAASYPSGPPVSYAEVRCDARVLDGVNSPDLSKVGLPRTVLEARERIVFDRFLAVAGGPGVAGAADVALEVMRQLGGTALATLRGRVFHERPIAGETIASLLISEGRLDTPPERRVPWTQVVPGPDGGFAARVPAGLDYVISLRSFAREVAQVEAREVIGDRDVGALATPPAALLSLLVEDGEGRPLPAEVLLYPADDETAAATGASLHGHLGVCIPWLGPPPGASPACNRVLLPGGPGETEVEVPPGRYHLYAYHGPFHTIALRYAALSPGVHALRLTVRRLPLLPTGALSADLHVHGAASFDSAIPDVTRVLSFAAADLDVIVASDHDVVYDYGPVIEQLGLADRLSAVSGVETTGHIPFLDVPGQLLPAVIGHYNFWPLRYLPGLPRNGGPFDEFAEPGTLFQRVDPLYTGVPVIMLNHPWEAAVAGRAFGFPRAIRMDLLRDLPAEDDGTASGLYVRRPPGAAYRNSDHHAQEVMNGTSPERFIQYRALWFYLLNQGHRRTGTANSDSHSLAHVSAGTPRNVVRADTSAGRGFDVDAFNLAVRAGAVLGTNGPIIEATITATDGREVSYGLSPLRPAPGARLSLVVSAAPWVPVEEIRLIVNGRLARRIAGAALRQPPDPFGVDGLVRYQDALPLDPLLPPVGDAWLVVEAGAALPLAADLSNPDGGPPDGVPDTTDNNGDGVVDERDVAPGGHAGPLILRQPRQGEPGYHFSRVMPGTLPQAFTNPFFLDRGGSAVSRRARP